MSRFLLAIVAVAALFSATAQADLCFTNAKFAPTAPMVKEARFQIANPAIQAAELLTNLGPVRCDATGCNTVKAQYGAPTAAGEPALPTDLQIYNARLCLPSFGATGGLDCGIFNGNYIIPVRQLVIGEPGGQPPVISTEIRIVIEVEYRGVKVTLVIEWD